MNKELKALKGRLGHIHKTPLEEALDRLYECNDDDYTLGYQQRDYKLLQQALQRLEAIDNANPSEALKGLKHIKKYYVPQPCSCTTYDYLEIIEQALLKAQEQEKVLDIIKEKRVIVDLLIDNNLEDYNNKIIIIYGYALSTGRLLTQEEFDLLRRYFG